jgi:hypothetical protein
MDDFINDKKILTGKEEFNINGNLLDDSKLREITRACKGLKYYWNCLEKAEIAQEILGEGQLVLGKLMVLSSDGSSSFGYYYKPPYEFHAWVLMPNGIIDVSLPGVIERGLTFSDDKGPFLTGRSPVVLAGAPASWMDYDISEIR